MKLFRSVGIFGISGYDFEVGRKNQTLLLDAKGLVKNLAREVKKISPKERVPDLTYLQPKWGTQELFGHREENGFTISIELYGAYKTGKQFNIDFSGPPAAMKAHEKDIFAWLVQFRILQ